MKKKFNDLLDIYKESLDTSSTKQKYKNAFDIIVSIHFQKGLHEITNLYKATWELKMTDTMLIVKMLSK